MNPFKPKLVKPLKYVRLAPTPYHKVSTRVLSTLLLLAFTCLVLFIVVLLV